MKIGIDVREFAHEKMTGIGRYLLNFLEWVAREKVDVEFILYANQYSTPPITAPNFKIKVLPEKITFIWDQVLLPFHLKKDRIDLFFSPYYKAPFFSPCPICVTIHDLLFLEICEGGLKEKIKNFLFVFIAGVISRKSGKVITDSSHSRKDIQHYLKTDERKIEVVSINTSDFLFPEKDSKEIERIRRKYNTGNKFILYIGNFKKHKNVERLLDAFHLFQADRHFDDFKLILGGGGNMGAAKIKKRIKETHREERVIFTGYLEEDDLRPLYSAAVLFAFPSLYEGYGLPVMEAMACGTPVMCSNRTSLPEISGGAATLVNPECVEEMAETMKTVAGNSQVRKDLVQKGLERVGKLNEVCCAEVIFNAIISCGSGRS